MALLYVPAGEAAGDSLKRLIAERDGALRAALALPEDRPIVIFDGTSLTVEGELEIVHDASADGSRSQWLIGPAGSSPRESATLWIYRDGCMHMVRLDIDGDGHGDCGYGGSRRE